MKNVFILIILVSPIYISGQNLMLMEISDVKTTVIYFPEDVKDVDLGFPDDFDKTFGGKVVKMTALGSFNYTTNLTVTTTGGIYGFDIKYKEDPEQKYYTIESSTKAIIFKEPLIEIKVKEKNKKKTFCSHKQHFIHSQKIIFTI